MAPDGSALGWGNIVEIVLAVGAAVLGILALAAGIAGYFRGALAMWARVLMLTAAAALMIPEVSIGGNDLGVYVNLVGVVLLGVLAVLNWKPVPSGEG